ncbi:MAG TPA: hypothetical protein VFI30_02130 [Nocardioidaceae bacterium]|nr:hypothetical protein [Nocardioidaceae bacterium]
MRHSTRRRRLLALAVGLAAPLIGLAVVQPAAQASGTPGGGNEIRPYRPGADDNGPDIPAPKSNAPSRVPASHVPTPRDLPVTGASGVTEQWSGLTMKDQRTANGGNSFSLEPPDQGLCVGNGYVIEAVNNVFSISTTSGALVSGPLSMAPFWNNGTPEIDRSNPQSPVYGPFVSDPKCYYDPATGRFFMTELQLGTNPTTGDFDGTSFENIAVSKSSTPSTDSSDWYLYQLDVANDGTNGTPNHQGCPCLGDQPLIGADKYGFYLTTNEFPIFAPGFNGAQIYAFDKAALESGTMTVQRIETDAPGLPLAEGTAYSVQPATSPTAGEWDTANNGTEYFMSALEFTGKLDNRIAVWALTNTASLASGSPDVTLSHAVVGSEVYGFPPDATQMKGAVPLADAVNAKENLIASNDDRMNQVVYADGKLWGGLNSVVKNRNGNTNAGIAYFVAAPSIDATGTVSATMANQGYVAVNRNNVIFPAIGVNPDGSAVLVFSLTGRNYFPSAAMVHLDSTGALTSGVQVLAEGQAADDGFSGYTAYGGAGVGRWGDYSAAVSDGSGNVWVATEYIPGTFGWSGYSSGNNGFLANWGTYVAQVTP